MKEESLIKFCEIETKGITKISIERYSYGSEIKKFAGLPKFFPLRVNSHHGVYMWNKLHPAEYSSSLKSMVLFNERLAKIWEKASKNPYIIIPNPYLLYLKRKKIILNSNIQRGSIFFYAHSTLDVDFDETPIDLIGELKKLPDCFLPVKICFHFVDILKKRHLIFKENGFECVSFGNMYNVKFVDNFFQELLKVKYVLSNSIGSHAFYSIYLGIPFSLIGSEPLYKFPDYLESFNKKVGRSTEILFEFKKLLGDKLNYSIDEKLLLLVKSELGEGINVSRFSLFLFLVNHTMRYYFNKLVRK